MSKVTYLIAICFLCLPLISSAENSARCERAFSNKQESVFTHLPATGGQARYFQFLRDQNINSGLKDLNRRGLVSTEILNIMAAQEYKQRFQIVAAKKDIQYFTQNPDVDVVKEVQSVFESDFKRGTVSVFLKPTFKKDQGEFIIMTVETNNAEEVLALANVMSFRNFTWSLLLDSDQPIETMFLTVPPQLTELPYLGHLFYRRMSIEFAKTLADKNTKSINAVLYLSKWTLQISHFNGKIAYPNGASDVEKEMIDRGIEFSGKQESEDYFAYYVNATNQKQVEALRSFIGGSHAMPLAEFNRSEKR